MENHGKKWTQEQEQIILDALKENKKIKDISNELKRTESSIYERISILCYRYYNENIDKNEILNKLNISELQMNQYIKLQNDKKEKQRQKQEKVNEEKKIKEQEKQKEQQQVQQEQQQVQQEKTLFSPSQQLAWDKYIKGENIFITGPGGNGKSYFIQKVYKHAIKNNMNIAVTAMTGCAALLLNCNAKTVHSWGNIGLGNESPEKLVDKIKKYKKLNIWLKTDILVIDEVSMLSDELFELLNNVSKIIRRNDSYFGNMQLIFSGDFHQLPPIQKKFCFESPLWKEVFKNEIIFKQNFRQKGDTTYQNILNEIRNGTLSQESKDILKKCINKKSNSIIKPTILFPIKQLSEQLNEKENLKINSKEYIYSMCYNRETNSKSILQELEKQKKNIMNEETLILKIGSQVMCTINLDQELGIINGSQGKVIDFNEKNEPIVKFDYNNIIIPIQKHTWYNDIYEEYGIQQIPLILSWAITIHKSQGITIEYANINIGSNIFECGQSYVALSRVKSLDGLFIQNIDFSKIRSNNKVVEYYNSIV